MCSRCAFVGALAGFVSLPALAPARTGDPESLELAMPEMTRVADTVWLGRLTPNVWIHTTTHVLSGAGYYPANGAIVADGREAVLIDTGWNVSQAREILDAWAERGGPPITRALVTHFHSDRIGGIAELNRRGIPAYANPSTIPLARKTGFPAPRAVHDVRKGAKRFGPVDVFYPGEGHTVDNIVAWVPSDRVLFGGCLVKSTTVDDLGNVADANVRAWPATMSVLRKAYAPRHVIPGHGTIAGDPILHTRDLADMANAK